MNPRGFRSRERTHGSPCPEPTKSGGSTSTRTVVNVLDVGREPRAMALDSERGRLYVASLISSNEHPRGPLQGEEALPTMTTRDIAVIDTATAEVVDFIPHVGTILRGLWLSEDGNTLVVGVSHSQNQKLAVDAESRPHVHGLAFVDVSEGSEYPVSQLDLDEQESSTGAAPSPFSMLANPETNSLWITLSAGASVLEVDGDSYAERAEPRPAMTHGASCEWETSSGPTHGSTTASMVSASRRMRIPPP